MKHISFFNTHKTLGHEHCDLVFKSIAGQTTKQKFDKLYIYNSHEHELPNESIFVLYMMYGLDRFFDEVEIFPYDKSTDKSLGGDVEAIKNYCAQKYADNDRVLIHKSDCLLSANYFDDIFNLPPSIPIYFTAPFFCAKKRVPNDEILEYVKRKTCTFSDEETFFVENRYRNIDNDFHKRPGITVTDQQIKYTSCTVIRDFSCHLISNCLMPRLNIRKSSWGGVDLSALEPFYVGTERSFVMHKFHDIVSENRATDREGLVVDWLNS